jgi:single-strand DNA-binding protein
VTVTHWFLRRQLWRDAAENVAECLAPQHPRIAHDRLQQRSYETSGGDKRTVIELLVNEIGPR